MDLIEVSKQLGENVQKKDNSVNKDRILKSPFDKTYIGRVVDREIVTDSSTNNTYVLKWVVSANGENYKIDINDSNITSLGQKVRVFIPSNNSNKAYAEVINPATAPDKIVFTQNDNNYQNYSVYGIDQDRGITSNDIVVDSIIETWGLQDKTILTKVYLLTVYKSGEDDEEVTNIICPDGKKINLEGFYINDF